MQLLSHPFRLEPNGAIATVEDDTEEAYAEGVAVLAMTRRGERDLAPDYGMTDPAFGAIDIAELNVALADYGPPVEVTDLVVEELTDTTERVVIVFNPTEEN